MFFVAQGTVWLTLRMLTNENIAIYISHRILLWLKSTILENLLTRNNIEMEYNKSIIFWFFKPFIVYFLTKLKQLISKELVTSTTTRNQALLSTGDDHHWWWFIRKYDILINIFQFMINTYFIHSNCLSCTRWGLETRTSLVMLCVCITKNARKCSAAIIRTQKTGKKLEHISNFKGIRHFQYASGGSYRTEMNSVAIKKNMLNSVIVSGESEKQMGK